MEPLPRLLAHRHITRTNSMFVGALKSRILSGMGQSIVWFGIHLLMGS